MDVNPKSAVESMAGGPSTGPPSTTRPSSIAPAGSTPIAAELSDAGSSTLQGLPPGPSARRRRGAGHVTVIACNECRKKRAKCCGKTPCTRCVSHNVSCVYEVPKKQTKDSMRDEIDILQRHNRQMSMILNSLGGEQGDEIIRRLRNGESVSRVYTGLESAPSERSSYITTYTSPDKQTEIQRRMTEVQNALSNPSQLEAAMHDLDPDAMEITTSAEGRQSIVPQQHEHIMIAEWDQSLSENTIHEAQLRGRSTILGPSYIEDYVRSEGMPLPTWTGITNDIEFVEHIMALYFCWEYPTFASLSKDHFLYDFRTHVPRYCSPLLVNAMLALGCRFSDLPASRADPYDTKTSGDHFFAEAKRLLLEQTNYGKLNTIQALGLMSIREASCGRDTESFYYATMAIQLAVELGLHEDEAILDEAEQEVRRCTFWGAFALDEAWSLVTGKLPHLSQFGTTPPKPSIIRVSESSPWIPYTDQGIPAHRSAMQPSNVHSIFACFCDLSHLIHKGMYTLYSPTQRVKKQDLVRIYSSYLEWYGDLPDALRLGYNFTPAVLFVHVYYQFAIVSLFRPFMKLSLRGSELVPRDICIQAADAITALCRTYAFMYTLARTPSIMPYIILTSALAYLVDAKIEIDNTNDLGGTGHDPTVRGFPVAQSAHPEGHQTSDPSSSPRLRKVLQTVSDLQAMSASHHFATRALHIIAFQAEEWGLKGIADYARFSVPLTRGIGGEATQMGEESPDNIEARQGGAAGDMFCTSLNELLNRRGSGNLLLTIFPLQGQPFVETGQALMDDGFEVANANL